MTKHLDGSKTLEQKVLDLYVQNGHYKHLLSRKIACDKIVDYINAIDMSGELIDPFLLKLFFIVAKNTYTDYRKLMLDSDDESCIYNDNDI